MDHIQPQNGGLLPTEYLIQQGLELQQHFLDACLSKQKFLTDGRYICRSGWDFCFLYGEHYDEPLGQKNLLNKSHCV